MIQEQLLKLPAVQDSSDPVVRALNSIADRQEKVYFDATTRSSIVSADLSKTQITLAGEQKDIQVKMLDALNEMNRLQAMQSNTSTTGVGAPSTTAVDPELEKQKKDNKARYDQDVANYNWWKDYGPPGFWRNAALANGPPNAANYQPMRFGGVVGAYANGGVIGNGTFDQDTVWARIAGGGLAHLAGGEGVLTAPATRDIGGKATVDYINQHRELPAIRMANAGNGDAMVSELSKLRAEVVNLHRTTGSLLTYIGRMEAENVRATQTQTEVQDQNSKEDRRESRMNARKSEYDQLARKRGRA